MSLLAIEIADKFGGNMKILKNPKPKVMEVTSDTVWVLKCSKARKNLITRGETCGAELELTAKDLFVLEYETDFFIKETYGFRCPVCDTIASVGEKIRAAVTNSKEARRVARKKRVSVGYIF